jgi:WS/DGAT/MGAT family acyltransferase
MMSFSMLQLSELDASFLYLETERTPLHVGGVFVFKRPDRGSNLNFKRFQEIITSILANEPFFRERLVEYPLNLDLPVWADDPEFKLENHVTHHRLTSGSAPLLSYASEFFSHPLDRTRPLWEAVFIEDLEHDPEQSFSQEHFALLLKVHITAIDGISGEDILSQLLHVSPEEREIETPEKAWIPKPLPTTGSWIGAAYNNVFNIPSKLTVLAKETAASAFYSVLYEKLEKLNLPASLMKVANTPINQKITAKRQIENLEIPLSKVRSIKRQLGDVTTNDVMMGICAEALSNYLKGMAAHPKQDLIALAPISVRSTSLDIKSGNKLSATLFSLASSESDPIKRIRLIHQAATSSSSYKEAIAANHLTELVPSCTAGLSARVYSEFLLAQKHKPMFNLPIINIPGPQFPLYFEDSELIKFISTTPLFDGIGLALMIVSYNGNYSITSTCNPDVMPLKKGFKYYLETAFETICNSDLSKPVSAANPEEIKDEKVGFINDVAGRVSSLFSTHK